MVREQEPQRFEKSRGHSNELEELYRSWGVLDLLGTTIDLLPPDWLRVLNISRNLLDGKPIPGVNMSNVLKALIERNVKIDYEKRLVTRKWQEPTEIPSDQIEVRPIKNLTELPRVLPPHLLLADIDPDLFAYQAISGNLPVSENQKPKVVMEEKSETVDELEAVKKVGSSMRQKVYVLLDVSLSMDDSNKLIFAKAVIMAYLAKAYEEEAQIYFRAFAGKAGNRQDCISENQFPTLAQYILNISTYPDTNIARALRFAISDIKKMDKLQGDKPATTEILLITDGGSHTPIPQTPHSVTLHTLHIQDGTEEALDHYGDDENPDLYSKKAFLARIAELTQASQTFTKIDPSDLRLLPENRDLWLLKEEVGKLEEELSSRDLRGPRYDRSLQDRIKKIRKMATAYRKMYSTERSKKTEAKELEPEDSENIGLIDNLFVKAMDKRIRKMTEYDIKRYGNDGSRRDAENTEKRARKMNLKLNRKRIKQTIKDALARRKPSLKRSKKIKVSAQRKLSGTLFDFRIKPDK